MTHTVDLVSLSDALDCLLRMPVERNESCCSDETGTGGVAERERHKRTRMEYVYAKARQRSRVGTLGNQPTK